MAKTDKANGGRSELVSFNVAISNAALAGDKLPERIKLLGWGESATAKGPVRLSDLSAKSISGQGSFGFGEIALDFEHNTVPGAPEYMRSQEPRAVAAYGKPEVVANDGLYLSGIRWTPEGEKMARNFADLSPAVQLDDSGNVIFIHSAALTRNGAVDGLHFFSASGRNSEEHKTMNIELADLASLVGLGADADKEAVLGSLKAKLAPTKPEPVTAFSVLVDGKEQRFGAAEILALSAEVSQLKADLKSKLTSAENAELEQAIKAFAAEGKVPLDENRKPIDAATLKTFSVAELKRLLANTPKTVALSASAKIAAKPAGELKGLAKAAAALNAQFANS